MTTSSLQFGPEWMRKGPSNASKQSNGGQQQQQQQTPSATTPTTGAAPSLSSRRNHVPGLGAMQSHSSGGVPTPVSTPTAAPSPGSFSFAAAAAGGAGADRSTSTPGGTGPSATNGSSSAAAAAALHHHQQLLSLYSSKEGSRGALSPTSEAAGGAGGGDASTAAPSSGTGGGSQGRRKLFPERERERDSNSRRSLSTHEANAMMSPAMPASEPPRGLNARGTSVSRDREADQHRPGLFQRANSSGHFGGATAPSPTLPRERFSGIQGGVLSGVVPPERRRKESGDVRLASGEPRKHSTSGTTGAAAPPAPSLPSAPVEEETLWERRGGNRNHSSSADASEPGEVSSSGFKEKPSLEGLASPTEAGDQGGSRSAVTPASASWSSARRRERAPGEGPIGPPADGSAGFGKFAAYERKRERMASHPASEGWRPSSSSASGTGVNGEQPVLEEAATKEDVRVEDASSALGSLKVSEESATNPTPSQQQMQPPATTAPWSAETQNWLYRDPSGQVQGPFSAALMQDWYQQSYFNDDLMIRAEEEPEFHRLIDVIAAGGHNPQPFLVPPPSMSRPSPPRPQQVNELLSSLHAGGSSPFLGHKSPQQSNNGWNGDGSWQAAAPQQQQHPGYISSPFDTAGGAFGSSPFLPYAGSLGGAAGGDGGFDAKLRQQEEYLAMIRHREMEEHRQREQQSQQMQQSAPAGGARGLSFGEFPAIDPFVGGWSPAPQQQQQQQQPWAGNQTLWAQPAENATEARAADSQQTAPWGTGADAGAAASEVQPIGTPVRSRSPVVQTKAAVPESKSKSPEEQPAVAAPAPAPAPRPATPQPEDPAPEHEWPQSPSAVEFATEPDMTQSVGMQDNDFQQARGAGKSAAAPSPQTGSTAVIRSAAGGNVRVVGADQFRKAGTATAQAGSEAPLSSFLSGSAQSGNSGTPAPAKAAPWAQQASTQNQDKGSENAAKSLREIQEAEARQAEARRAAERAAAAQRRANSANTGSDSSALPSTMSWGLASIPSSATAKADAAASTAAAAQQPAAWTDTAAGKAAGTPKKTLTEIQEEERKRAQNAQQLKQAQNAAARKAYLESATRQTAAPTSAAAAAASGWSVVGAGGKASTPAPTATAAAPTPASIPARPTIVGASGKKTASSVKIPGVAGAWGASGTAPASSTNGISTPASIPAKPPATRKNAAAAPSPSNSSPAAPSPEFIRYCHEQLKGLNVKVDDFIEMLLSFPLDPSQDVVEIIADSIYANSSTLDGRRVANDFVAKRKMDAGFRGDVGAGAGAGGSAGSSTGTAGGRKMAGGGALNGNGGGGAGGTSSLGNRSPTNASSMTGGTSAASAKGQNGFQQVVKKGGKRK